MTLATEMATNRFSRDLSARFFAVCIFNDWSFIARLPQPFDNSPTAAEVARFSKEEVPLAL